MAGAASVIISPYYNQSSVCVSSSRNHNTIFPPFKIKITLKDLSLDIDFFSNHKTGEIMSRLNDAGSIRDALSNVTLTIMMDVVMVIACAVLLYKQSHILFLLASVIFVLYVLISASFVIPIDNLSRDVMEKSSVFTSHLKESFDGMIELKAAQRIF